MHIPGRVKLTARRGQLVKPIVKPTLALMCHWLFFQASSSTYPSAKNKVGCQIFIFDLVMSKTIFQYFLEFTWNGSKQGELANY